MSEQDKSDKNPLSVYYQVVTPKGLTGGFELVNPKKAVDPAGLYELVLRIIVNTDRYNAYTVDDIIERLTNLNAKSQADRDALNSLIQVYSDRRIPNADYLKADVGGTVSAEHLTLTKCLGFEEGPVLSRSCVILSNTPFVSLNVRNIDQTVLFLQAIPTLEMSKAVPFLDVNFQFDRESMTSDNQYNVPSLIKFLEGAVGSATTDNAAGKMMKSLETKEGSKTITEVDMSLFTSPQTLVNPELSNHENVRTISGPVGDKFRPLASLDNINISIVASPSVTVAYKALDMELVLHDKSRLAEIADMIRPETYVGTSMVIRYGWSHPDNPKDNPYAELINSMRVEERYGVKNASYSFDEYGQVKIKLNMFMLGENMFWLTRTSESREYRNKETRFEELRQEIYKLMSFLGVKIEPETRAYQIMSAVDKGVNTDIDDKKLKELIRNFSSKVKNDKPKVAEANELAEKLNELVNGDRSIKSMKEALKTSVSSIVEKKYKAMKNKPDFFLLTPTKASEAKLDEAFVPRYSKLIKDAVRKNKDGTSVYKYVSLAKVLSLFVLEPLQASNRFEEVHLVFYPFNSSCGLAGGSNIGNFPIEIETFKKVMSDYLQKRGSVDMTLGEFIELLKSAFIADPAAIAYGMQGSYEKDKDGKSKPKISSDALMDAQDKLLQSGGGSWKNPNVEFYVECLSKAGNSSEINQRLGKSSSGSILKIHVYDKASSPWEGFMKLKAGVSQLNNSNVSKHKDAAGNTLLQQLKDTINGNEQLKAALDEVGARIEVDKNQNIQVFDIDKIKKVVSSRVPTLVYGSQGSGLLKANLQSIQEPRLATVNLQRSAGSTSTSPNGAGAAGLPLRIIPGQVDITMIGCPTLSINQQFFIDFGTNTSLDNFYGLTGASHRISAGKFETSAKFIWMDAYGSYENIALKLKTMAEMIVKSSK